MIHSMAMANTIIMVSVSARERQKLISPARKLASATPSKTAAAAFGLCTPTVRTRKISRVTNTARHMFCPPSRNRPRIRSASTAITVAKRLERIGDLRTSV